MDSNKYLDIIFFDFKKAFDKVSHKHLLTKLKTYGITGKLLKWIENWLSGRKQRVVINGCSSNWINVTSGVPQGSVLSPILFLIFIDDIDNGIKSRISKFADDTKISMPTFNLENCNLLQNDINSLCEWAEKWQMSFNADKCNVIHFGSNNTNYPYKMFDQLLNKSSSEKDLGIVINDRLKSDSRIDIIVKRANKLLGLICRSFEYKSVNITMTLFNSIVRPHLEYGSQFWNPHFVKDIHKLERVQRRATKVIPCCKNLSYEERLKKLNILSLEERRRRADLIYFYKIINNHVNLDVHKYVDFNQNNTRGHRYKIKKRKFSTDLSKYSYFNRITDDCNSLPSFVVESLNISTFKMNLKIHFDSKNTSNDLIK